MGLRGGEDSKRSDGEAEDEAAESAECVAGGFTLMEAVRPLRVALAEIEGASEIVLDVLSVVNVLDEDNELDSATGKLAHSMRTRWLP